MPGCSYMCMAGDSRQHFPSLLTGEYPGRMSVSILADVIFADTNSNRVRPEHILSNMTAD